MYKISGFEFEARLIKFTEIEKIKIPTMLNLKTTVLFKLIRTDDNMISVLQCDVSAFVRHASFIETVFILLLNISSSSFSFASRC